MKKYHYTAQTTAIFELRFELIKVNKQNILSQTTVVHNRIIYYFHNALVCSTVVCETIYFAEA